MFKKGKDRQAKDLQALFHQGKQCLECGKPAEAMEAFAEMREIAQKLGIPLAEADAIFYQAQALESVRREGSFGREMAEKALEYYKASRTNYQKLGRLDEEALALHYLADLLARSGQFDEALEYFQAELAICRKLGSRSGEARTLFSIASVHAARGEDDMAVKNHEASLAIWRELGNHEEEARVLIFLGNLYAKGDPDRALERYESCLAVSREAGYAAGQVEAHYAIASIHQDRGDWHRMIEAAQDGVAIAREAGLRSAEVTGLGIMGFALEKLNRLAEMEEPLLRAIKLMKAMNHPNLPKYVEWLDRVRGEMGRVSGRG